VTAAGETKKDLGVAAGAAPIDPVQPPPPAFCRRCGGEGRLIYEVAMWSEPVAHDGGECPNCEGTGREPIDGDETALVPAPSSGSAF